jgi:hypothetical protein
MKKSLSLIVAVAVATGLLSNVWASAWGQPTIITGYYIYEGGSAYIRTTNNQNPDSCGSTSYLYIDPSAPRFKEIWSQVMMAQATGTTVSIFYSGCSPGNDYPRVAAIAIPNVW